MAVGEIRGSAVDAHHARLLLPFENAVVGNVAPQQISAIAEIDRTLGPAAIRRQSFDAGELEPVFLKEGIEGGDGRIWITRRGLPAARRSTGKDGYWSSRCSEPRR